MKIPSLVRRIPRSDVHLLVAAIAFLALGVTAASGQQTTERYIPIGASPGVSGVYSYIGEITAVDRVANTITVATDDGPMTIRLTPKTTLWLDQSGRKRENLLAGHQDCEVGRKVEVMHTRDDKTVARWIKIESS